MFAEEEKENYSTHGNHRPWGRIIEYSSRFCFSHGNSDLLTLWVNESSCLKEKLTRHTVQGTIAKSPRIWTLSRKKVQKSRSKSGDRMMLAPMANRFKERSLLEPIQNHASNYQGAPGLSTPSDPPRKKWLFSEAEKENKIFKVLICYLNVKSASRN